MAISTARTPSFSSLISFFVFLTFVGATSALADNLADVTKASNQAQLTIKRAVAEKNSGLLSSLFTSDGAVISAQGHSISGRLQIRMAAKIAMLTGGSGKLSTTRNTISLLDDTAYETGSYTLRLSGETPQQDKTYNGYYTLVWRLEEKVWKVHRAIGMK